MAADPHALSTVSPEPPAGTDYDAICAAVTATARGRWFLDEFAKRNRNTDTTEVLAAIARMEAAVVGERTQQASREAHQEVQIELLEMARTIAQARAEVAESRPPPAQQGATELANTISPDVAAAAERLRQIAWTMRACGIELPASDQIGQIARDDPVGRCVARPGRATRAETHRGTALSRGSHRPDARRPSGGRERRRGRARGGSRTAGGESPRSRPAAGDHGGGDDRRCDARERRTGGRGRAGVLARCGNDALGRHRTATADIAEYPMDDDVVLTVADSAVAPAAAASLAAEPIRSQHRPPTSS